MAAERPAPVPPSTPPAIRGLLVALVAVGTAAIAWAAYLWRQLFTARGGGEAACGFGDGDCAALWDGAFASWVHHASGLPVAGWGVAWGVAAALLPLAALLLADRARLLVAASRWTAIAGLAGLAVLVAVLVGSGGFCGACAVFYLLVLVYAGIALWALPRAAATTAPPARRRAGVEPWHGPALAGAVLVSAWLLLLWPGGATPHADEADRVLATTTGGATDPAAAGGAPPAPAVPATAEEKEALLRQFLTNVEPAVRQVIADQLAMYAAAEPHDPEPPEGLAGDATAPVVVTEFADTLCDHCARLHVSLAQLAQILPPASFAIESRHFPLDGNCNPHLPVRGPESVRCLAAKARICMEELGDEVEYAAGLYSLAPNLTADDVYTFAERWTDSATLRACVASPETAAELRNDVDYAQRYDIQGTPLVLVDGREAPATPPLLFALVLSEGDTSHPAFDLLPPPEVAAPAADAPADAPATDATPPPG